MTMWKMDEATVRNHYSVTVIMQYWGAS